MLQSIWIRFQAGCSLRASAYASALLAIFLASGCMPPAEQDVYETTGGAPASDEPTAPPQTVQVPARPPASDRPRVIMRDRQDVIYGRPGFTATRIFAGPEQYPPEDYAAYGLVAFKSLASTSDRQKYLMICEAYIRTLPHSPNVSAPVERQMVTVWPIDTVDNALKASNPLEEETCEFAVNHYGLEAAHDALDDPQIARYVQGKRGPFLLAWAPTATKGTPDALVLVSDLSYVSTDESAKRLFERWREEIENDPSLWDNDGWSIEKISIKIADWADYIAPRALSLIPGFS